MFNYGQGKMSWTKDDMMSVLVGVSDGESLHYIVNLLDHLDETSNVGEDHYWDHF